ncbi:MAG: hypothetical protein WCP29_19380 [Acidobacteriota bacterium]
MAHHSPSLLRAAAGLLVRAAAIIAAVALPVAAQETTMRSLVNEPGTWHPWTCGTISANELKLLGFTTADANAFKTRLKQIADVFRASPVWTPPLGVNPALTASLFGPSTNYPYPKGLKGQPLAGMILMGSFEHFEMIRTVDGKQQRERAVGDETVHIIIDVNSLPRGGGVNMLKDEEGEFSLDPVRTADVGGFPTYGDLLVITTNGRPIWTPVSRERYLKALIAARRPTAASAEVYIAAQQKQYDAFLTPEATAARQAKYRGAIDKVASKGAAAVEHERRYWERDEADQLAALKRGASRDPKISPLAGVAAGVKSAEDELATMSPADRGGPACLLDDRNDPTRSGLVAMGTPKCVPLVGKNPNFFDPLLPRSVPQIVIVHNFLGLAKRWKEGRPTGDKMGSLDTWTTYEVFNKTDWQKVAAQIGK